MNSMLSYNSISFKSQVFEINIYFYDSFDTWFIMQLATFQIPMQINFTNNTCKVEVILLYIGKLIFEKKKNFEE